MKEGLKHVNRWLTRKEFLGIWTQITEAFDVEKRI